MELLGLTPELLALFVSFGFMVGVFFGFFGMGGSFLVTPALLILGYPAPVAIGSSMAFVFGTAVIATLKHHDVGEVDYKLGALMFVGIALGIEAGKMIVLFLDRLGQAELVVGIAYILLLAAIGLIFTRNALKKNSERDANDESGDHGTPDDEDDIPDIAKKIKSYNVPPMVTLTDGSKASMWTISGVGGGVGVVSGFLGVGGGFIRMPAIYYLIGVSLTAAVGTSLFGALMSGAVGAFTYGLSGVIDLGVVTALLVGSALGARIGSASTAYVDEDDVTIYFGIMLLLASTAVAFGELATWFEMPILDTVSFVLLIGSSVFVTAVILYYGGVALREKKATTTVAPGGDD
ncbi:putative permease, sulfite exporter TauE/SafE [Halalkaliarchaeum desulfuricum]|uniref:Probable membrane transporter protein n=1 Tax=Halalkaliarchaeum desulfuricum TaxID=2055893 RepID=A0A343TFC2_9EURY|nr:sulfite exporter TauE/SafE family protein [Halalkaliarchaeum desulfuricum]AUX07794.1 putative permease, sulfite exporter TauE/SafE [Halalkaliarchaeum desulfuricum]